MNYINTNISKIFRFLLKSLIVLSPISLEASPFFHLYDDDTQKKPLSVDEISKKLNHDLTTIEDGRKIKIVLMVQGMPDNTENDYSKKAFAKIVNAHKKQTQASDEKTIYISLDSFIKNDAKLTSWALGKKYLFPVFKQLLENEKSKYLTVEFIGHSYGARAILEMTDSFKNENLYETIGDKFHYHLIAPHIASYLLHGDGFHRNFLNKKSQYAWPLEALIFSTPKFLFQDILRWTGHTSDYAALYDLALLASIPGEESMLKYTGVYVAEKDETVENNIEIIAATLDDLPDENGKTLARYIQIDGVGHVGIIAIDKKVNELVELIIELSKK